MTTYVTDADGKFIPSSQRPDGTWRKARRVKEGYVPQEEVPLYESKGKQFANRKSDRTQAVQPAAATTGKKEKAKKMKNPLPAEVVILTRNSTDEVLPSSSSKKNPNESSNNKKSSSVSTNPPPSDMESVPSVVDTTVASITKELNNVELDDLQLELSKKIKKLKKKIREIEAIESKLKGGDLKKPEKDQLDKVKRKKEYLKELQELEQQQGATD